MSETVSQSSGTVEERYTDEEDEVEYVHLSQFEDVKVLPKPESSVPSMLTSTVATIVGESRANPCNKAIAAKFTCEDPDCMENADKLRET